MMMRRAFQKWWADQNASTAIEYGLIAGGVALLLVGTIFLMGEDLLSFFATAATYMADAVAGL